MGCYELISPVTLVLTMLEEINSHRAGSELILDAEITAVSEAHAQWLDSQSILGYQSTGSGGTTPAQRLTNAGVTFTSCDETGCYSNGEVPEAYSLMSTAKLTNPTYTHVGIWPHQCSTNPGYYYWVVTLVNK
jgi:uncharacterized protein YkwD